MRIKKRERILLLPGYRLAYTPVEDETPIDKRDSRLRALKVGQKIRPERIEVRPRNPGMSEAALLKALHERGIGRPSTYSEIISEILRRKYVRKEGDVFVLTSRGEKVQSYLSSAYPRLFDLEFSAYLEKRLDALAAGKTSYRAVLSEVWRLIEGD